MIIISLFGFPAYFSIKYLNLYSPDRANKELCENRRNGLHFLIFAKNKSCGMMRREVFMSIISMVLATLVALEFFFIMFLETFMPTSKKTADTFHMDLSEVNRDSVSTLFRNQGVYNGLLGVLILLSVFAFKDVMWTKLLMIYIIIVAAFGSLTSSRDIILKQGGLAILTLISLFIF